MKKNGLSAFLIFVFTVSLGIATITYAAPGASCNCFDDIEARIHCQAQCNARGATCMTAYPLSCSCDGNNYCDCSYKFHCSDGWYSYGLAQEETCLRCLGPM